MRVVTRRTLKEFWGKHPDAKQPLDAWYHDARRETWKTPNDIKSRYNNVSIIANNRVVFNIKGNSYRLIIVIHYDTGIVYIRFVGTHQQYDRIDARTV